MTSPDDMMSAVPGSLAAVEERSTYVPFVRARQFAAVAAAARDRVYLGLRFTSPPSGVRLAPATAPGQATHKVALRSVGEVDDEVTGWLAAAYAQNG